MHFLNECWTYLTSVLSVITLDPLGVGIDSGSSLQHPIIKAAPAANVPHDYPIFDPPNPPEDHTFKCSYPSLRGYEDCSTHSDRGCWLRPKNGHKGMEYNIHTDYENIFPKGITRKYHLDVATMTLYPDGVANTQGKVFNQSYPGPWIEACWGDMLEITVKNDLPCNGTSIHWHGIRQHNTGEMDGVNAITQCPIAPGDSFTYKFRAMQYGSTWYHSHYSLQYPDGMVGPMTIYGPSSGNYDAAKDPILVTDWNHRSAFEDWSWFLQNGQRPEMTSLLLNGMGRQYVPTTAEVAAGLEVSATPMYSTTFQKGVRYLLRLINTSVDNTFVFSIDGHNLTMISSDFVPIKPYTNTSVLIGIGQRYHVIVEAKPFDPTPDGNYWIRTTPATGCSSFNRSHPPDERSGILRYNPLSEVDPTSRRNTFDQKCSDETYTSLEPILPWTVQNDTLQNPDIEVALRNVFGVDPYYVPNPSNANRWELHKTPMWLDFSKPTLLNLDNNVPFRPEMVVITQDRPDNSWIELVIVGFRDTPPEKGPIMVRVAHPIHLHGHDFALLAQSSVPYTEEYARSIIKRDNPPRRDVALLPQGGFLVIAFKADNPGSWLMHCHIAWHASSGLALQVLENKDKIHFVDKNAMLRTCRKWDYWKKNEREKKCSQYYPFQDDSGI